MKHTRILIVGFALASVAWGQSAAPIASAQAATTAVQAAHTAGVAADVANTKAVEPLKPITASVESQNAILKAEHELDTVKDEISGIKSQFQELQRVADQLNPKFKADQEKQPKLEAAVNAAVEAAYKANGMSKDKYNFDPANFTFTPKPETPPAPKVAQAAAAPAK